MRLAPSEAFKKFLIAAAVGQVVFGVVGHVNDLPILITLAPTIVAVVTYATVTYFKND